MRLFPLLLMVFLFTYQSAQAQQVVVDSNLVQFSGMVLDGSDAELYPVPYTNILVKGKNRGTYSDFKGFFTIVVQREDTIVFSTVGYKSVEVTIPDSMDADRYSIVQLMVRDTFNLPETVVFPWPSREHFKLEFLAMDVSNELQERAVENLAQEVLERASASVASDGDEHADYFLRKQARDYYYIGQAPPMNIFNPIAWKQFFDSWKNGDFKKKKDKK
ncbi:MAG: carboxypeptidase-like regulatory domain-containing protein [Bacteroidota bacterium]